MKKVLFSVLVAAACAAPIAGTAQEKRVVTVSGEGEVTRVPDLAKVSFGVSVQSATSAEALAQASGATALVLAAMGGAGIATEDILTSGVSLSARYDYDEYGNQVGGTPVGYIAMVDFWVTCRDLDQLGALLSKAVEAGANRMNGIEFALQDRQAALEEARAMAVRDAKARAQLYVETAGDSLGELQSLSEIGGGAMPMFRIEGVVMDAAAAAPAGMPIAPGVIEIEAMITATFEIID